MTRNNTNFSNRRAAWVALLLSALITLAIVIIPVWVIQPFKPQTSRGLAWAMAMRYWSPLLTIIALLSALVLAVWLCRGPHRWWRNACLVLILLTLLPTTWS